MLKVYLYAHFLGPYWIAPIHNLEFVARLRESQVDCEHLGTRSRMEGMLGKQLINTLKVRKFQKEITVSSIFQKTKEKISLTSVLTSIFLVQPLFIEQNIVKFLPWFVGKIEDTIISIFNFMNFSSC